jgi:hypothetical protein
MGWFEPTVNVAIRPEADGTATLVVDLREEGQPAILGDIDVQGLVRNSREQVLACLGLKAGQPLNAVIEADIARKLAETHCFVTSKVEVIPPPFGDGPCKLVVTVTESLSVPRLGEPLTPLQQRMVGTFLLKNGWSDHLYCAFCQMGCIRD